MKILIVDDKEEERYLAETLLTGSGYEVETAVNGVEALEKLRAEGFDMIVSDVLMPVMDGFRLCRECKGDEKLKDIPFVFYTATYKDETDEVLASKMGADKYIRKPIEPEEFVKIIQGVFRDVEEGKIGLKRSVLEEEEEVFKLYSERLIEKLEKKMLELEAEIAQRQRAEEQTKQLQEYLELQIQRMPIGLIVWDTEFRVRSWNLSAEKIFGFTQEEALGKHPYDLIVPKEAQPQVDNIWSRLLEGDDTAHSQNENITKDGLTIFCDWANTPLKGADGTIVGVLSMVQDITERKQAEETLRESEERYRNLIDNTLDMVQSVDIDGHFIFVNRAWLEALGYTEAELPDLNLFNIIHPESLAHCQELFAKVMRGESVQNVQATFIAKDGREILTEGNVTPRYVGSNIIATQGIFRDITESKKMQEQLMAQDRLASIGELSSGIAHELNNPLTSVIGFSELLLEKDISDDVKEDLVVINREAQRTAGIVRNLLTFARKHPQEKGSVDINKLIQNVLGLRAYEQKVSNIEVNAQFATDLPEVIADSFQLQQVFINIIINAEHFMIGAHGRGTLVITTEQVGDIIRASFADDGPGITKKNLGHIFDPFFTTKEVGKGTGLGLSISYGIITEHGGRIYAESKLGKGATFIVELPINKK